MANWWERIGRAEALLSLTAPIRAYIYSLLGGGGMTALLSAVGVSLWQAAMTGLIAAFVFFGFIYIGKKWNEPQPAKAGNQEDSERQTEIDRLTEGIAALQSKLATESKKVADHKEKLQAEASRADHLESALVKTIDETTRVRKELASKDAALAAAKSGRDRYHQDAKDLAERVRSLQDRLNWVQDECAKRCLNWVIGRIESQPEFKSVVVHYVDLKDRKLAKKIHSFFEWPEIGPRIWNVSDEGPKQVVLDRKNPTDKRIVIFSDWDRAAGIKGVFQQFDLLREFNLPNADSISGDMAARSAPPEQTVDIEFMVFPEED